MNQGRWYLEQPQAAGRTNNGSANEYCAIKGGLDLRLRQDAIVDAHIIHFPIEPGMVFTVEPGLYIPAGDLTAPAEFRGIGVRIEDNIWVTNHGCEIMTSGVPK